MVRIIVCLGIATSACTHAQAPKARAVGEVMSIGGVVGIVASVLVARYTSQGDGLVQASSVISGVGIVTYAVADLSDPIGSGPPPETAAHRHHRWAKILTEEAAGAAREGKCPRVRRYEPRVRRYDAEVHDFVFMRDPEIVRCLRAEADASP